VKPLLLALVLAAASPLHAAMYRGTVTHVTDGDTVWVRPAGGSAPLEIRLLDLDAPEGCQSFGPESKGALRGRLLQQAVRVRTGGTDDYGRQLARIDHRGEDVGRWMVSEGYAWSTTFRGKPGPYARQEAQARDARRGLWALPGALDPRSFRKRFGRCQP
jgi:endonuclease YncB( thermonuclease family)